MTETPAPSSRPAGQRGRFTGPRQGLTGRPRGANTTGSLNASRLPFDLLEATGIRIGELTALTWGTSTPANPGSGSPTARPPRPDAGLSYLRRSPTRLTPPPLGRHAAQRNLFPCPQRQKSPGRQSVRPATTLAQPRWISLALKRNTPPVKTPGTTGPTECCHGVPQTAGRQGRLCRERTASRCLGGLVFWWEVVV